MALDTVLKRASAIGVMVPFMLTLPSPDGAIGDGDRQATAYSYSGISATTGSSGFSSLSVKKLTFTKPTSPGVQAITGVGFQGVAVILWSDRQAAAGVSDQAHLMVAMTDGTTQVVRYIQHPDNEAATTSAQSEITNRFVFMTNATSGATPTIQAEATFGAFTADGFTINWTTADATPSIFHALVIGGIQANLVSQKITVTAGNSIDVTGVGFRPEAFIVLGGAADEFGTGDYNLGAPWGSIHGFGFSNASDNMCGWTLGRGTAGASDTNRGQHTDRVVSLRTANVTGAADLCSCQIVSTAVDGFRITRTVGSVIQPVQHILALRGATFLMGALTTPASPDVEVIATPDRARAVLLQTHGLNTAESDGMSLAMGAWDGGGNMGGTWIGGTDNANPSVYARATYTAAALRSYSPAATGSASTLQLEASISDVTDDDVTVSFDTVPASPVQVLYLVISDGAPVTTGGTIPIGVNPEPGDPEGDVHFAQFVVNGVHYFAAETLIRDPQTAWGGKKPATLMTFSPNRRTLAREGYPASTFSLQVSDTDGVWRGFSATDTLESIYVALYRCKAPNGIIVGQPFRLMAGRVQPGGFSGEEGFLFSFECVDVLGDYFADPDNQPQIPSHPLTTAEFLTIDPSFNGKVGPRALGYLVDDGVGVVDPPFLGQTQLNVPPFSGPPGVTVDVYLISEGAVYDIPRGYYNPPTWVSGIDVLVGDLIRPTPENVSGYYYKVTVAGTTGGSEPTWPTSGTVSDGGVTWQVVGLDDTTLRFPIPADAYGNVLVHPHSVGWTAATGLTTPYVDYNGRRYTVVLILSSHPAAKAWREKRIQPLFDVIGATSDPTGAGGPIFDPGYLDIHILTNYLFYVTNGVTYGTLPELPALPGETPYSVIDTVSADAAKAIADAEGGYLGGFLLGPKGAQQGLWDVLNNNLKGSALERGQNRHGQLMYARRNIAATGTYTIRPQRSIIKATYKVDASVRGTSILARYAYRYASPFSPIPTPSVGQPLPPIVDATKYGDWAGTLVATSLEADAALAAAYGQARAKQMTLDNYVTRDPATATNVAIRQLDYGVGPSPAFNGTMLFEIQGPWHLLTDLDSNGKTRELNDVVTIVDPQGMSATGYVGVNGRITWIEIDAQNDLVTLGGEILDPVLVDATSPLVV